jgi:hypothetical protein
MILLGIAILILKSNNPTLKNERLPGLSGEPRFVNEIILHLTNQTIFLNDLTLFVVAGLLKDNLKILFCK